MIRNMKRITLMLSICAVATGVHASSEELRNYIEIFRSGLSTAKKQAITDALRLTDGEATVFWPIYREYEVQFDKLADERVALIEQFMKAHTAGTLDSTSATAIAQKWFTLQQKRLELWKKYHGKMSKALSPVRAAQFLQVENQVSLFVDLSIASEMPVLGTDMKE